MKRTFLIFVISCLFTVNASAQEKWSLQVSPLDTQILGKAQFVSPTEGWITAGNGMLLHTTNGGTNWNTITPSPSDTVEVISDPAVAMSFVSSTTGWVIGTLGDFQNPKGVVIYKTTDGGNSWSRKILTPWTIGVSVQFIDENNGWVTVFNGAFSDDELIFSDAAILRTTDGGTTWSILPANNKFGIPFFVDTNRGWMVADSLSSSGSNIPIREILHTADGGISWTSQFRDDAMGDTRIFFSDANNGWVVGESAKIYHTTDGGTNWLPITNTGIAPSAKSKAVFFLNANVGWIGSRVSDSEPFLLHTTDGGQSWLTESVPNENSIFSIYFVDANNGWLVSDYGSIAHTSGEPVSVQENYQSGMPSAFTLKQNYPNPFNPTTTISFTLPSRSFVSLKVFDIIGREVATLVSEELPVGNHSLQWNAEKIAAGTYFCRLQVGNYTETKKLILLK